MLSLARHITACNNTTLPGGRLRLLVAGHGAGWVRPAVADQLSALGLRPTSGALSLDDASALPDLGRRIAEAGLAHWRGEPFDVHSDAGHWLGQVDRGALPLLGLRAGGVHLNGLVDRPGGPHMWLGRRAADKRLDPGKLDHIAAGGIAAGMDAASTLAKEAAEEAGLPGALAAAAVAVATLRYVMERPEGLRRDVLHCYDLWLPGDFVPQPVDGEVAAFELWPIAAVLDLVRRTDAFKFNVNLVLIDCFLRLGLVPAPEAATLRVALSASGNAEPLHR